MGIAQQIIAEEVAKAMLSAEFKQISAARAFAALPAVAREFAVEIAANVEERMTHLGVPISEIMEGQISLTVPNEVSP